MGGLVIFMDYIWLTILECQRGVFVAFHVPRLIFETPRNCSSFSRSDGRLLTTYANHPHDILLSFRRLFHLGFMASSIILPIFFFFFFFSLLEKLTLISHRFIDCLLQVPFLAVSSTPPRFFFCTLGDR